jgi:NAD(P)-dependent dehydrogenase (short-subunit alcohol dehydrogenase family)
MTDLALRRALVTGGNRGIGLAIAKGLKQCGLDVTIGSRNRADGETAVAGLAISCVELDVSDPASIALAVADAGPFDVLVNNAGVLFHNPMLDEPDGFRTSMAVMVEGPYNLIRACAPHMAASGYGRIVNVSSGWGAFSEGITAPGAYGVAKAALNALTLSLSQQLPATTKINALCPGWVKTRMGGAGATRSVEEGADTAIWLATLAADGPTGSFFRNRQRIGW